MQPAVGGYRVLGSTGDGRRHSSLFSGIREEQGPVSPTLPRPPHVRPAHFGGWAGKGSCWSIKPLARAAVSEKQITSLWHPFLAQGTEMLHFMASGYQRTAQDGR
jgi:hypothetical protein